MKMMDSAADGKPVKEKLFEVHLADFRPVPFFQSTCRERMKSKRSIQYHDNQKTFAWLVSMHGQGRVNRYPVSMNVSVVLKRPNMRSDNDNYLKSAKDALMKANVLPGDNLQYVVESKVRIRKGDTNAVSILLYEDTWP
jgi:Holliday junction resolvase RusA-like endonuclease